MAMATAMMTMMVIMMMQNGTIARLTSPLGNTGVGRRMDNPLTPLAHPLDCCPPHSHAIAIAHLVLTQLIITLGSCFHLSLLVQTLLIVASPCPGKHLLMASQL